MLIIRNKNWETETILEHEIIATNSIGLITHLSMKNFHSLTLENKDVYIFNLNKKTLKEIKKYYSEGLRANPRIFSEKLLELIEQKNHA